jgi:hypothetical protein
MQSRMSLLLMWLMGWDPEYEPGWDLLLLLLAFGQTTGYDESV